jgi:hypothetical protein
MILVRHGLMIIGETLSGKTSAYKALSKTLNDGNAVANAVPDFLHTTLEYDAILSISDSGVTV